MYRPSRPLLASLPLVVGFALASPEPARAADPLPGRMPNVRLPPRMKTVPGGAPVGSWVEYSIHDRVRRRRLRVKWALVGKVGTKYWWEVTFRQSGKAPLTIKALFRGRLRSARHVERIIMKVGPAQALELPLKKGQRLVEPYVRPKRGARPRYMGTILMKTAAGTFNTRHVSWKDATGRDAHEWTSPQAKIWGLVMFVDSQFKMELIGQGTRARSRVRGVPAKWRLPGL